MMASEPKRVSEFRTTGDTNPGLGQAEVIQVDPEPPSDASGSELGAVLAASTRAGASLSALHRAIQQVTEGVTDAREANAHLTQELARVREMLGASNEERLALKNQLKLVSEELVEARAGAARDREFLVAEQDRFLAGLLEEQEAQLSRVVQEREEALKELAGFRRGAAHTHPARKPGAGPPQDEGPAHLLNRIEKLTAEQNSTRDTLRRLQTQRDEAHAAIARLEAQVADAREEVALLRASGITAPPDPRRTQPAAPMDGAEPAGDDEGWGAVDASAASQGGDRPTLDAIVTQRATVPPAPKELAQAIVASRRSPPHGTLRQTTPEVPRPQPTVEESGPPIKRKPDPATGSLGGYSVRGDDVESETVVSSKPPRS